MCFEHRATMMSRWRTSSHRAARGDDNKKWGAANAAPHFVH